MLVDKRMKRRDFLFPVLSLNVARAHPRAQWARAEQRDAGHDVTEAIGLHVVKESLHAARLELEHPLRFAGRDQLVDPWVIEWETV